MTHYETVDRIAAIAFRHLPNRTARDAQDSHRRAKAIAVDVAEDLARVKRVEVSK